ncbi:MAG: hypothetical protein WA268_26660 [Xanthobacteraceae bacterium]
MATDYLSPANGPSVEIVRVTSIFSDKLTISRPQETCSIATCLLAIGVPREAPLLYIPVKVSPLAKKAVATKLNKQEAIRRLVHAAIRMLAAEEDPFAVHLLIQSADKTLIDVAKKHGKELRVSYERKLVTA